MMKKNGLKKKLIAVKIYFDRARMYLGYINFFMLNVVLINSFDNPVLEEYTKQYKWFVIPVLFIVYAVFLTLIGYLDTKLGLRQEEMRNNASMNPVLQDLVKTVHDIRDKVINEDKLDGTSSSINDPE